ncbi:MAG: DUF177 domain-containing protein [Saprospiraceae bacterium]|nr:DUF177 domain-containing protein [Saprospiraceae bacterium]
MPFLKQFVIPLKGLLDGQHQYQFRLDKEFFIHFESSPIQESDIVVSIDLDKHLDLMTVRMTITGWVKETCDRCLAEIKLPVSRIYDLVIKKSEGESEDPDLILLNPEAHEFSFASLLYEYACLAVPLSKVFACEEVDPKPCNEDVLKYIKAESDSQKDDSVWDVLKNIKNN